MDLAGELLQDLSGYLGLEELASRASFPAAMEAFKATLAQARRAGPGLGLGPGLGPRAWGLGPRAWGWVSALE
jgi:hypothetical protein